MAALDPAPAGLTAEQRSERYKAAQGLTALLDSLFPPDED